MQDIKEIISTEKWPPKNYPLAYIQGFAHWYTPQNLNRIDEVLNWIKSNYGINTSLDIAFGNPFLLEREMKIFPQCKGLYITLNEARSKGISESLIAMGNCYQIPYDTEQLDLISAYALLHIIPDIPEFYKEAYRVLRKGGFLYTDGDRNINMVKIVRKFRMIQYRITRNRIQFDYWRDILRKKENFHQEGINDIELKNSLLKIGFSNVIITPWFSFNPDWEKYLVYKSIKKLLILSKIRLFSTHMQIIAIK